MPLQMLHTVPPDCQVIVACCNTDAGATSAHGQQHTPLDNETHPCSVQQLRVPLRPLTHHFSHVGVQLFLASNSSSHQE